MITRDTTTLVLVQAQSKTLTCFSQLACDMASKAGLTELTMVDHDVKEMKDISDKRIETLNCFFDTV
jgi:hypothetical protein